MSCPLCNVWEREPDNVFFENDKFVVMRTKNLKGHKERVMILSKEHVADINTEFTEVLYFLRETIKPLFQYTSKVVVMDRTYGSIPDHWHYVVTDLDPNSDDFYQVLGTPWIEVIHVKGWHEMK